MRNVHARSVLDNYDTGQMPVIGGGSHAAKNYKKIDGLVSQDKHSRGVSSRLSVAANANSNQAERIPLQSSSQLKNQGVPNVGSKSSAASGRLELSKR